MWRPEPGYQRRALSPNGVLYPLTRRVQGGAGTHGFSHAVTGYGETTDREKDRLPDVSLVACRAADDGERMPYSRGDERKGIVLFLPPTLRLYHV